MDEVIIIVVIAFIFLIYFEEDTADPIPYYTVPKTQSSEVRVKLGYLTSKNSKDTNLKHMELWKLGDQYHAIPTNITMSNEYKLNITKPPKQGQRIFIDILRDEYVFHN